MFLRSSTVSSAVLCVSLAVGAIGCKQSPPAHNHGSSPTASNATSDSTTVVAPGGSVTIRVDGSGYHPPRIRATANSEITLSFLRTTDECCGQQLKIPSLNINRDLPLNQPVAVAVRVPASGELGFTCGMDMYRGAVVIQ